jgi:hypothetical protein
MRASALGVVALMSAACSSSKQAPPPVVELPPACMLADRVLTYYQECRRGTRYRPEILADYQREMRKLWNKLTAESSWKAARMCSFTVDRIRTDMTDENCTFPITDAERAIIADARVQVTPTPRASTPETQQVVDAYAAARDAMCKCADKPCVSALAREIEALPLEKLQSESEAVHKAFDAIGSEAYDCAVQTSIQSPDRWKRVK